MTATNVNSITTFNINSITQKKCFPQLLKEKQYFTLTFNDKGMIKLNRKENTYPNGNEPSSSEVPRKIDKLIIRQLVKQALEHPTNDFNHQNRFLEPGTDPTKATLDDIAPVYKKCLELAHIDKASRTYINDNFFSFIRGKEALSNILNSEFVQEMATLMLTSALEGLHEFQHAQAALKHKYECLNKEANTEFNLQYLAPMEAKLATEWGIELEDKMRKIPLNIPKRALSITCPAKKIASSKMAQTLTLIEIEAALEFQQD